MDSVHYSVRMYTTIHTLCIKAPNGMIAVCTCPEPGSSTSNRIHIN